MSFLARFLVRWLVSSLGLWIAANLLGEGSIDYQNKLRVIVIAGLVLALVNMFIKPLVVLLSLPAILLSLGLFTLIINGLMILLVSSLYDPLQVSGFGTAVLAGIIVGLVNYLVTTIVDRKDQA